MKTALYPGSFDPVTNGHIDIARRAALVFDRVVIGIFDRPSSKKILFSVEERLELAREAVREYENITAEAYAGLTVAFAKEIGATALVRGLRASADFELEFEMAMMNKKLMPDLELVCFMSSLQYQFLSSSLLKEVTQLGGCIDGLVPDHVAKALRQKFGQKC